MSSILLLGSSSQSRQMLLKEALIEFQIIGHAANEDLFKNKGTLHEQVRAIAEHKMAHCSVPNDFPYDSAYILTADTMGMTQAGDILGKPKDRSDALEKLKACNEGVLTTATAFCLEKRVKKEGLWKTVAQHMQVVAAQSEFYVPENWLDRYLEHSLGLVASGAVAIELYGAQFLKSVSGSYTAIVGLPICEVREALEKMGFFEQ